jgi:hypothetical protein
MAGTLGGAERQSTSAREEGCAATLRQGRASSPAAGVATTASAFGRQGRADEVAAAGAATVDSAFGTHQAATSESSASKLGGSWDPELEGRKWQQGEERREWEEEARDDALGVGAGWEREGLRGRSGEAEHREELGSVAGAHRGASSETGEFFIFDFFWVVFSSAACCGIAVHSLAVPSCSEVRQSSSLQQFDAHPSGHIRPATLLAMVPTACAHGALLECLLAGPVSFFWGFLPNFYGPSCFFHSPVFCCCSSCIFIAVGGDFQLFPGGVGSWLQMNAPNTNWNGAVGGGSIPLQLNDDDDIVELRPTDGCF